MTLRIAVLNWSNRRIGGTGSYLGTLLPALRRCGHDAALWHELDAPTDREPLPTEGGPVWSVQALGLARAITSLEAWDPDVLYVQGFQDPLVEQKVLDVAPAVFFAHDFYGTCISGTKTFRYPTTRPCDRVLGWECLAQYYPRRCGGLSPLTMWKEFSRQSRRLEQLRRYRAVVTHSGRMRDEYVSHGFDPARVMKVPYGPPHRDTRLGDTVLSIRGKPTDEPWRLLFVGRMYRIKGGRELIEALPRVVRRLQRSVHLTFAGDGAQRAEWESLSAGVCEREPRIQIAFTGWLGERDVEGLFDKSDLLVVPSLWPEPYGLVGPEAACHGVPAAAYAVGGIPEWLKPGVNGHLASGCPPTIDGLADAIVACLKDPHEYTALREGARRMAEQTNFDMHLAALRTIFDEVCATV